MHMFLFWKAYSLHNSTCPEHLQVVTGFFSFISLGSWFKCHLVREPSLATPFTTLSVTHALNSIFPVTTVWHVTICSYQSTVWDFFQRDLMLPLLGAPDTEHLPVVEREHVTLGDADSLTEGPGSLRTGVKLVPNLTLLVCLGRVLPWWYLCLRGAVCEKWHIC